VAFTQKLALMLFNCFQSTYNVYVDVYVDIAYILFLVVGDSGMFSAIQVFGLRQLAKKDKSTYKHITPYGSLKSCCSHDHKSVGYRNQ